ncbi:hypothetical protein DFH07DRAFT_1006255 [Mycena maculata]|uniref:Uncharacterized protein n=1 Tax=Mycena maculata TaxID=230809 RepID=A0AAD7HKL1_9AGAR|nr:hypothetical protein DFH07DRAFT_1006255 [Mycena maculata]
MTNLLVILLDRFGVAEETQGANMMAVVILASDRHPPGIRQASVGHVSGMWQRNQDHPEEHLITRFHFWVLYLMNGTIKSEIFGSNSGALRMSEEIANQQLPAMRWEPQKTYKGAGWREERMFLPHSPAVRKEEWSGVFLRAARLLGERAAGQE